MRRVHIRFAASAHNVRFFSGRHAGGGFEPPLVVEQSVRQTMSRVRRMTAVAPSLESTSKSLGGAIAAPRDRPLRKRRVQPRHRGAATAFFIVTGGGLESWVKQESNLRMFRMIMEVAVFIVAIIAKEVFRRWAARYLD